MGKRVEVEVVYGDPENHGKKMYKLHEKPFDSSNAVVESRKIPIAYNVDVVVIGSGVSGLFSAIAAGRAGADTLLIERQSLIGGNLGPAMIIAGAIEGMPFRESIPGGPAGIPKEFLRRFHELKTVEKTNYAEESQIAMYLGYKMCEEAGVDLILNTYAADTIIEDGMVKGLFLEGKSGRVAVISKVIIDATGDASMAKRAGVPMIERVVPNEEHTLLIKPDRLRKEFEVWNETALAYLIGGVDFEKADDVKPCNRYTGDVEYSIEGFKGSFDTNSMDQMSEVDRILRVEVFERVQRLRREKPGYANSYLMAAASYTGARGGPCIEGEHVLTIHDAWSGQKFDDVICRHTLANRAFKADTGEVYEASRGYNKRGFEHPYRMFLPKEIDGMLVTGRGASYIRRGHDAGGTRHRVCMMTLGEVCGIAAAQAVKTSTSPKTLDIKKLQRSLLSIGYNLGEEWRLKELELS